MQTNKILNVAIVLGQTPDFINNWYHHAYKVFFDKINWLEKCGQINVIRVHYWQEMPETVKQTLLDGYTQFNMLYSPLNFDDVDLVYNFGTPTPLDYKLLIRKLPVTLDDIWPAMHVAL
jgi:hypothetical protein